MKIKGLITALWICLLLTACGFAITPETESSREEESTVGNEQNMLSLLTVEGTHVYGKLGDNLEVDMDNEYLFDEVGKHAAVSVELIEFDYQEIANRLWDSEIEFQTRTDGALREGRYKDGTGKSFYYSVYEGLSYGMLICSSDLADADQIENVFRYKQLQNIHGEQGDTTAFFNQYEDLSFCPAEDAVDEILSMAEGFGMDLDHFSLCREEVYSLTKESLKEAESWLAENYSDLLGEAKGEWTEENECYKMYLYMGYDGIPIYNDCYHSIVEFECTYSKDGIQSLNIINPLLFVEETSERQALLTVEEALEKLVEEYGYSFKKYALSDMYLCYYPAFYASGVELVPVWCMELGTTYGENTTVFYTDIFLDAITGEWVAFDN